MTIIYENEYSNNDPLSGGEEPEVKELACRLADSVLNYTGCPFEAQVSLLITDDASIREMNRSFRGIDRETDVLSFPMLSYERAGDFSFLEEETADGSFFDPDSGELIMGDIVISADRAKAQAEQYGHSLKREYAFLIVHSMLHLCGFDHMLTEEAEKMEQMQREILEGLGILRETIGQRGAEH